MALHENISYHIANGLSKLEKGNGDDVEVLTIKEAFGRGANDEDWIPLVGKEFGVVITQDFNIFRKKLQRERYESHGVGLFIIRPPSKKHGYRYWEMVQQIINHWPEIKGLVQKNDHLHTMQPRMANLKDFDTKPLFLILANSGTNFLFLQTATFSCHLGTWAYRRHSTSCFN